ncbi:hypothetical protein [Scytonema sp. NUACC26]|uniref:hypothetical protein n=1 Tax=Scytonema sp. NUACC26 TaxID=3140176 RepID=UPI0038B2C7DC
MLNTFYFKHILREQFVSGFITITPIDGDWSASDGVRVRLSDRLNVQNLLP